MISFFIGPFLHRSVVWSQLVCKKIDCLWEKGQQHCIPRFKRNQKNIFLCANNLWNSFSGIQVCCNPTWYINSAAAMRTAALWDWHHKECSVRMQQQHFGKYSVLEQGKSWADRRVLTSLTAQSLSRLLIPPDINSRLCFTFTSICRERTRLQKLSAISDFSLFLSKLSLSWPLLCVCRSPFTLSHFFCLSLPLPYLPPHSVCDPFLRLCWDFLLSPPLQPYSLSSLPLKFICKHGPVQTGCTTWPAPVKYTLSFI